MKNLEKFLQVFTYVHFVGWINCIFDIIKIEVFAKPCFLFNQIINVLKILIMNLENLNLVELNAQEVKETEGGFIWVILGAIATACIADWDNFERGLSGRPCKIN